MNDRQDVRVGDVIRFVSASNLNNEYLYAIVRKITSVDGDFPLIWGIFVYDIDNVDAFDERDLKPIGEGGRMQFCEIDEVEIVYRAGEMGLSKKQQLQLLMKDMGYDRE